ncbi:probable CCR4-associated factor 1 homolog 7 [Phoenix dactylifera]|uniref:poly(A)-specific ribonuclease n=1 Tax=Phoenix dactylifera TaxID=42345 RepID=A0A8B8ZCZ3_PHODC|nr:probable CCR4-associated factor 1 homolog 7 [Phoenix dactylifera]
MSIPAKTDDAVEIREVWADNLEAEITVIRDIVDQYPFVAMDTEFPGVAITPVRAFKDIADKNYQTLRANVDLLHLIQIGFTFSDAAGRFPLSPSGGGRRCVWQFNFREFDVDHDVANPDSIDLLRRSGIDFKKNRECGVDALRFAELLMSSGVVLNDSVQWIAFHGAYDFAYLLKILTCRRLPETSEAFSDLVSTFFPTVYDIKHLMRFCNNLYGGLNKVAEQLDAERIGFCHQAGSDSLLTVRVFWRLKEKYFDGSIESYAGLLYGLET